MLIIIYFIYIYILKFYYIKNKKKKKKKKHFPDCKWIEKEAFNLITFFKRKYCILFPEINVPLVLFRYTSCLALPRNY